MRLIPGQLAGVFVVEPTVTEGPLGFVLESFRRDTFAAARAANEWVVALQVHSSGGTVHGMHLQPGQAKLIGVVDGEILDVACDLRVGSPTFRQWEAHRLDDVNHHQLLVPDGVAHGFCVISPTVDLILKTSAYENSGTAIGFKWDDPEVGIEWPNPADLIASRVDESLPLLDEIEPSLSVRYQP